MEKVDRITSGPITRTVLSLALPVTIGMLMEFLLHTTDYFWVGRLGSTAQDAVMTSMVIAWTVFASFSLVTIGVTALVARYTGARNKKQAAYYVQQGFSMAVSLGIVVSLVGYFFSPALIRFMGAGAETVSIAVPYTRIFFCSAVIYFILENGYAAFRASGDTATPTKIGIGVVLLNMILDPMFIFGFGPIPTMGVPGASLASAISVTAGAAVIMGKLSRGGLGYPVENLFRLSIHFREMIRIGRIGLPMFVQQFTFVSVYWFLIKIVHEFGEPAAAAMGIGNRMESFSYLTSFGISMAASTMVGQNLGAGKPDRAAKCAWGAVGIGTALSFAISLIFLTIPELIAGLFSSDPQVVHIASDYLVILGLSQVAMAIEIILEGAFSGAGDTVPPMIVMLPGSAIRIPLAYYLCFYLDWGINGVWWTLTFTTTIKAIVLAIWFQRGRWKLKEI